MSDASDVYNVIAEYLRDTGWRQRGGRRKWYAPIHSVGWTIGRAAEIQLRADGQLPLGEPQPHKDTT